MSKSTAELYERRAVLLSGEEDALRRRALSELVERATIDGDFDLQTFEGDQSSPVEWLGSAGTAPFLGDKRTVVVRHLLRCEPSDGLDKQIKSLPETSLLILVADDELGDEGKQRRLGTLRKAWEKVVKAGGGEIVEYKVDSKQIRELIKGEAHRLGKKISDAGAESLAEMTGGSLSRAVEELEKLAIYLGEETAIRESDIRTVVMPAREWNVFRLIDSMVEGSVPEALRQLRILVGSQTKAEEAAFSRIFPMMSRQLRLVWQARVLIEARSTVDNAPPHILQLFSEKSSLAKEPPYRVSKLMQQARRVSFEGLASCLAAVAEADAKIKGLEDSFSPIDTLEQMVLQMVEVLSPRPVAR